MVSSEVKREDYLTSLIPIFKRTREIRGTIDETGLLVDLYELMNAADGEEHIGLTASGFPTESEVNQVLNLLTQDAPFKESTHNQKMHRVKDYFGTDINRENPVYGDGISNFGFIAYDDRFGESSLWIRYSVVPDRMISEVGFGNFGIDDIRMCDVIKKKDPDVNYRKRVDVIGPYREGVLEYRTFAGEPLVCKRSLMVCDKDSIESYLAKTEVDEVYTI